MKCKCISRIEQEVKKMDYVGKKVLSAKFLSAAFVSVKKNGVNTMEMTTTSKLEIELEGVKKKKTIDMMHTYCPFCGEKIKDETLPNTTG